MIIIKIEMSMRKINCVIWGWVLLRLSCEACSKEKERNEKREKNSRGRDERRGGESVCIRARVLTLIWCTLCSSRFRISSNSCIPWTARRSNQSNLKETNPEYPLEGLMLKRQYSGHLMWRAHSLEKTRTVGRMEGQTRRGVRWLDGITCSIDMSLNKLRQIEKNREALRAAVHGVTKSWAWLSD